MRTATVGRFGHLASRTPLMLSRSLGATQMRSSHDLAINRKTSQPLIKYGPGGRSSVNGHIATVFGCTGFLGRYIVNKLAQRGVQVVVPFRGESDDMRHLKPMGDLGQIVPLRFDARDPETIAECVRHSDTVYNLIGRSHTTKNFSYEKVHVDTAQSIARACKEAEVARFIHVSALNASEDSPSAFLRSKKAGEIAVRKEYADATIVRPSTMYGHEDNFLNSLGSGLRIHFLARNEEQRLRPTYVADVALSLETMMQDDSSIGQTYELYGPQEYTMGEIERMVAEMILKNPTSLSLPKPAAKLMARALDLLWWPTISPDEIERQYVNDTLTPGAKTYADLSIAPASLDRMALQFVRGYRSPLYYEMVPEEGASSFRGKSEKVDKSLHTTY